MNRWFETTALSAGVGNGVVTTDDADAELRNIEFILYNYTV
jgi:hypothetical protein